MTAIPRRAAPAAALLTALFVSGGTGLAAAETLMPHRAGYVLSLDPSKPSQKLDGADGRIDYEIRGNSCEGYTVALRQSNRLDTGEGPSAESDMLSTSWEDGKGEAYRFKTVTRANGQVKSDVDAIATRSDGGVTVQITKPRRESVELKGPILMPTEHVRKVLAAAAAGESILQARVFDGSETGEKVYDTLAVIGRPGKAAADLPEAARTALADETVYPVTVSYFDGAGDQQTPVYAMSLSLYANGVIGGLKIDYNDFVLRGVLDRFEPLKPDATCAK
ncbi:cell envelope integrity EipB family protein [Aquabacter spiritensis]|uniref:Uncharacterized protein DUF1849 n=1 Tax=Aquabacter spiritensis TaxID=933073 RepID=A0A4R3LKW7_9HYPH|nr:cell envelope integrity EipB family protein [Aquabacter spiritensis]TCT00970.1 uncharacterized protein DUF1849 [Aquabacter spiritensis]